MDANPTNYYSYDFEQIKERFINFNNEYFIASDSIAFPSFINKQIILEDGDYGYIDINGYQIFDHNNKTKDIIYKDVIHEEVSLNQKLFINK